MTVVTAHHEALHRIFQERPEIVVPALRLLDVSMPEDAGVETMSPDCTEIEPVERRADTVVHVSPPGGDRFSLVVESQGRKDPDKPYSWAYYLSHLMDKHKRPAQLLVLSSNPATAKWAEGPFKLGLKGEESVIVRPWVLGPGNVPVVTDAEEAARDVPVAALSAVVHREDPALEAILEPLARALGDAADEDIAKHYTLMVEAGLGTPARREVWRILLSTYFPGGGPLLKAREQELKEEFKEQWEAEIKAELEAEGEARAILRALERRGIHVTEAVRERVTGCTDLPTLDRWFDRAFDATNAEDLFAEDSA